MIRKDFLRFLETAQEDQEDIEIGKPTVQPAARNTTGSERKSGANFTGNMFGEMNNEDSDIEETDHVSETVFVVYKPPRRDDDCRVCKYLDSEGDTQDLYDYHLHNYPSGCPRYIQMSIYERNTLCFNAKICMKCHDPEYVWKSNDS